MFDLGKTLKTTRNRKFMTIEEVSSITKIKEHYIVSLEEEDMEQLPARVYTVGFIKNLADLYDLPLSEMVLAYDRLKENSDKTRNKRDITRINKSVYDRTHSLSDDEGFLSDNIADDDYGFDDARKFEETFSKIKKLSLDDQESTDGSISIIDDYIASSEDELKTMSIMQELEKEIAENKEDKSDLNNTFPTSKVMLEFEELMKEEERFNTQKMRKLEAERNINKTKNRVAQNKGFGMNHETKSGASMMILILLSVAILVLLYIIIKALVAR